MTESFKKRFPIGSLLTASGEKFGKVRGHQMHLLHQQSKVIDRLIRQLIEEMVIALPRSGKKLTAKQIRAAAQKQVEDLNQRLYTTIRKQLEESIASATRDGRKNLKRKVMKNLGLGSA
jgi:hypothetical protein